jgi:hypothetical protein
MKVNDKIDPGDIWAEKEEIVEDAPSSDEAGKLPPWSDLQPLNNSGWTPEMFSLGYI